MIPPDIDIRSNRSIQHCERHPPRLTADDAEARRAWPPLLNRDRCRVGVRQQHDLADVGSPVVLPTSSRSKTSSSVITHLSILGDDARTFATVTSVPPIRASTSIRTFARPSFGTLALSHFASDANAASLLSPAPDASVFAEGSLVAGLSAETWAWVGGVASAHWWSSARRPAPRPMRKRGRALR